MGTALARPMDWLPGHSITPSALVKSEGGKDMPRIRGRPQIDEQLDLGDTLDRQVEGRALQDTAGVGPGVAMRLIRKLTTVRSSKPPAIGKSRD